MNAIRPDSPPTRPSLVLTLARLLERLERSAEPVGAEQYRSVVLHLVQELDAASTDPALPAVLDSHPATAELYENLNYAHAGLCRSGLEASLNAELRAKDVIDKARRPALKQSNQGATSGED